MAGNTEITLTIGPDLGAQDGEPAFEADRVDYRITCGGSGPGSAPIPPTSTGGTYDYDDSVDVSGAFEIVDADTTPVWYTVTDLPPGDCTATLSVYRDGAVVCLGSEGFSVLEDPGTAGQFASEGRFSWGGAYHTTYWVDPAQELVVVYMTQLLPARLDDHQRLAALVYQSILESGAASGRESTPGSEE